MGTQFITDFYSRILEFKKAGIKVLISLGGWNDSGGDKFSRLVNNPEARKKFNEHALSFIQQYGFDGLDLDWEFPKCWQVRSRFQLPSISMNLIKLPCYHCFKN